MSRKYVLASKLFLCYRVIVAEMTITEFARKGGKARAAKLSDQEREESARKAAKVRWSNRPPKETAVGSKAPDPATNDTDVR